MSEIFLSAEQLTVLTSAEGLVAIRRPDGGFLGWVSPTNNFIVPLQCPFTPEEIAQAEARAQEPGPWYTTKEVLEYLRSLEDER